MASIIEVDVSANIAKFKAALDKAALEGQRLNKKLDRAFKGIRTAMKAVGVLAGFSVAGGLGAMAKSSIDAADKIQKLSTRLGASAEALSQYRYVASQAGVSFETLTMGWQRMTRRVAEAAQGTGEAKNALKELGISATALNKLAPEKQFEVLAEAISKVENPADKVRLSIKLFDSEGVSLIQTMKGGAQGLADMRAEADRLGVTLSTDQVNAAADANDAIDKLTKSISGAFQSAVVNNTGAITKFAETLDNIDLIGIAMVEGLLVGFERLKGGALFLALGIKAAFIGAFDVILEAQATMIRKIGEGMNFVKAGSGDFFTSFADGISNVLTPLDDFNSATSELNGQVEAAIDNIKKETRDMADAAIETKKATGLKAKLSDEVENFAYQTGQSAEELKKATEGQKKAAKAAEELRRTQERLTAEYRDAVSIYGKYADANEEIFDTLLDVTKTEARRKGILKEVSILVADGSLTQEEANKVLKQTGVLTEEVGDKQTELGKLWERTTDSMYNAMEGFFYDGLDGWDSFADSIKDTFKKLIASISAQWAASGIVTLFNSKGADWSGFSFDNAFSGGISGIGGGGSGGGGGGNSPSGSGSQQLAEALGLNSQQAQSLAQGAGGVVNVYGGIQNIRGGNEVGGTIQTASGAVDLYNSYQGLTGGAQLSGTISGGLGVAGGAYGLYTALENGDYTSAAINAYQTYSSAQAVYQAYQASQIASGAASGFGGGGLAGNLVGANATGGAAATGGISTAATAAGWAAVALLADQYLNNGRVTNAFGVEAEGRYQGVKDLFDGDFSGFTKSLYKPAYEALKATFGGQGTDSLGAEQLQSVIKATEEGRNQMLALTDKVALIGGFNQETTFFDTGITGDKSAALASLLEERLGLSDAREIVDGIFRLEDLGGDFTQNTDAKISEILASIAEVEIGFTDLERGIVKNMGDAFIQIDKEFDKFVAGGMDSTEAVTAAVSEFYGKSTEEANTWIENSGLTIDRIRDSFLGASGDVLSAVINDFGQAEMGVVRSLDNMATAANQSYANIRDYAASAANSAAQSFSSSIARSRETANAEAARNRAENDRLIAELRATTESNTALSKTNEELSRQMRNAS